MSNDNDASWLFPRRPHCPEPEHPHKPVCPEPEHPHKPVCPEPERPHKPPRHEFCPGGTVHIVKQGETFWCIAQGYGITLDAILAANPGVDPMNLQIGQKICIPVPPCQI